jgi:membrane protein involved in colicin uptake
MSDTQIYTTIGSIFLAVIGIFKRQAIWNYLTERNKNASKKDDRLIELYERQINELREDKAALQERIDNLIQQATRRRHNKSTKNPH